MTSEPLVSDVRIGGKRLEIAPHNCFACGTLNTHGLHLELHASEDVCWVDLDEVMAWALVDHDLWGVTARMSVEFRRPVPIGRPVRAEGRVVSVRRRLVEAEGVVLDGTDGSVLARGTATFFGAPEARKEELKARILTPMMAPPAPAGYAWRLAR